jgi:formate hydrogenlyase subunit 6/NADH:ubiquinone oxidoreductase subunit I
VLTALTENRDVYALAEEDGQYRLVRADRWIPDQHTLGSYRQIEPLKSLLFRPREYLGAWSGSSDREPMAERIVIGVKNCDLSAVEIHDNVFLNGDVQDPLYAEARDNTILVTADCTGYLEVCFCPAIGEQPYPTDLFDINISPTPHGHLLETGTDRGADVLLAAQRFLKPADEALLDARETQRATMEQKLLENAAASGLSPKMDFRGALETTFESSLWEDFAADCVECGACNFICCTCHCFLIADGLDAHDNPARCKQWDSCLFPGFACTAGGDPRPRRAQRLRNRFDKKFIFFPEVLGRYACDGCGRCTEACIGKIDIRAVLKRAVDESGAVHADSSDD